jgi:hypothetical protein
MSVRRVETRAGDIDERVAVLDSTLDWRPHPHLPRLSRIEVASLSGGDVVWGFTRLEPGSEVPLHDTLTVDLIVVVEGEVLLVWPGGVETKLELGDCLVQGGNLHGWRNASTNPATLAVVNLSNRLLGGALK